MYVCMYVAIQNLVRGHGSGDGYKNSSGDEIANVNFFYDDTLQSYTHFKI